MPSLILALGDYLLCSLWEPEPHVEEKWCIMYVIGGVEGQKSTTLCHNKLVKAWVNEPICNFAVKLVFNSKLLIWPKFDFDWWTSVLLSMKGTYSQIIMSGKPAMIPGAFIQRTFNTNVYDDTAQDFRYFQHLMSFYQIPTNVICVQLLYKIRDFTCYCSD